MNFAAAKKNVTQLAEPVLDTTVGRIATGHKGTVPKKRRAARAGH